MSEKGKKTKTPKDVEPVDMPMEEDVSAYEKFVKENKKHWLWFNLMCTIGSIGMAIGTFVILANYETDCVHSSLRIPLYFVGALHCVNAVETLLNLTGLEKKLCTGPIMCVFLVFEVIVLIYMQVAYFEDQRCFRLATMLYIWLCLNILLFYVVLVVVLCFFFRKFCGEPEVEEK